LDTPRVESTGSKIDMDDTILSNLHSLNWVFGPELLCYLFSAGGSGKQVLASTRTAKKVQSEKRKPVVQVKHKTTAYLKRGASRL
jgi:hypothetical protein